MTESLKPTDMNDNEPPSTEKRRDLETCSKSDDLEDRSINPSSDDYHPRSWH